eukprot:scaffold7564_cov117-Cylindrotheca_fusiformis.AAC.3
MIGFSIVQRSKEPGVIQLFPTNFLARWSQEDFILPCEAEVILRSGRFNICSAFTSGACIHSTPASYALERVRVALAVASALAER